MRFEIGKPDSSYSPEESKDNKLERLEDKFNPVFD